MRLKKQQGMPTSPVMERLPDLSALFADKDSLIHTLHALAQELRARLEHLEGEECQDARTTGQRQHKLIPDSLLLRWPRKHVRCAQKADILPEGLQDCFQFYNHKRLHQSLGYRTPAQVYFTGRCYGQGQTGFYQPAPILIS